MAPVDVLFLTGASPSAVRHAGIRVRTLLAGDSPAEAARKAREQERRSELLTYRLATLPGPARQAWEPPDAARRALMASFLAAEARGTGPVVMAAPLFARSPGLWRELAAEGGNGVAMLAILSPIKAAVAELSRDDVAGTARAQMAWLEAYLPCLGEERAFEAVLFADNLTSSPAGLGAALAAIGFAVDQSAADARPKERIDGVPHMETKSLLEDLRDWEPLPVLKQVQAALKTGQPAPETLAQRAKSQLAVWWSLAGDPARERARVRCSRRRRGEGERAPFFILGSPRSGTTMLRNLLRQNPDLLAPEETFFFRSNASFASTDYQGFYQRNPVVRKHRALDGIGEEEFAEIMAGSATRRELSDGYMRRFAELRGKPQARWFDKTPQNVYGLPLIAALYPEATIVHIHRHPIEVAASARAGRALGKHTLTGALNVWLEPMLIFEQCRPILGDRLIEFSIDELKRSPEVTTEWLAGMLDLEPFDYTLDHLDRDLGSRVVDEVLSPDDIAFIESRCAPFMLRYGYRPYPTRRRAVTVA